MNKFDLTTKLSIIIFYNWYKYAKVLEMYINDPIQKAGIVLKIEKM